MKRIRVHFLLFLLAVSCGQHSPAETEQPDEYLLPDDVSHEMIVLGRKLDDPYTVSNVEKAIKSVYPTKADQISLEPTDIYIRFLPKNEEQYERLMETGLLFYDHPIDYQILKEGDYYHDPDLAEDKITWQYTVMPSHYVCPFGITYEVLDECYIPGNEVGTKAGDIDWEAVEQEAFRLTGNAALLDAETRGEDAGKPSGRVTVVDARRDGGGAEGVAGVKVSCNTFVKFATAYTDADGYYHIERSFSSTLRYRLVFQNEKGFGIGLDKVLVPASSSALGKASPEGLDVEIDSSSDRKMFCRAVVNNAAWDYFERCSEESEKLSLPPANTRLWLFQFLNASSAVMLQHGVMVDDTKIGELLGDFKSVVKMFLPDITLGLSAAEDYSDIYALTVHELAHASHFSQVGKSYWNYYISHILSSFLSSGGRMYGTGSEEWAGYCEVGEMWAYYMQNLLYEQRYGEGAAVFGTNHWFYPHVFLYLDERGVGRSMIAKALTPEVTSRELLLEKLEALYPEYGMLIGQAFERYSK